MKQIFKEPSIWLLIFLVGFPQISETIYTPSLPELAENLNATGNEMQQTLSIYFFGFALGVLLWGILSDKIGRRPSMLYGIVMYIVGSIGCLLSYNVELLLLSRVIQAAGAAAGSIVTQTVMRDCYDDSRRPQMFAKISAVLAFSPAIGPLMGSIIAQYCGVSYVFVNLVLIGLLALVFTYTCLSETAPQQKTKHNLRSIAKQMLTDKHIWIYASLIGIINGIIFCYYGEAPFIFINILGFSVTEYGSIGVLVAVASFIGAVFGKQLVIKMHYTKVMKIGYSIMLIGLAIFLSSALFISIPIINAMGYLLGIFLVMVGIGVALPSCLSNALIDYKHCLGISGAYLGLMYYAMVCLITGGMSLLHTGSPLVMPIYMIALTILLLYLTFQLKHK
mgnify:CR=1 FL=1